MYKDRTPAHIEPPKQPRRLVSPDVPLGPVPWRQANKRRAGIFERILTAGFILALLLFAYDYILGGSQATGYLWFQARVALMDFLAWRIEAFVWILVPLVAFLTVALRGVLPVIEIPVMHGDHGEAQWVKRWYFPGTLRTKDDLWTWREGRYSAHVHRRNLARRGALGWAVTVPVERYVNETELEVTYDTREVTTYLSRTMNHRLQQEVRERTLQDERFLRELM